MTAARAVSEAWSRLGLRWKLVVLNAIVVAVAGLVVLMLVHHIAVPSVDTVMHAAQSAPTPQMAQDAYTTAVDRQVVPAVAISAAVAIGLNLLVVTWALRPLSRVADTTRRIAAGDLGARVGSGRSDEVGDVARSVDEMAAHLERLEALRRRTTDDVAHELRTPLHNILGLVEAMRDGVLERDAATLDRVGREVERLTTLVDDLRLLADARAARDHLGRERTHLAALAREVLRGFDPELGRRSLEGRVMTLDGADVEVDADPGRIAQVLRNLVANAVRHATPGTTVEVRIAAQAGRVRVEVVDTGDEIPAAVVPFVFERFVRADPSRSRDRGGAGIGLAIVKELVEAHDGSVGARSGDGSVSVWFELPLTPPGRGRGSGRAAADMSPGVA